MLSAIDEYFYSINLASSVIISRNTNISERLPMNIEHTYANYVDDAAVKKIKALEKETGMLIMAYATPYATANLSPEQLKEIEALEKQLCVRLVAYKSHSDVDA